MISIDTGKEFICVWWHEDGRTAIVVMREFVSDEEQQWGIKYKDKKKKRDPEIVETLESGKGFRWTGKLNELVEKYKPQAIIFEHDEDEEGYASNKAYRIGLNGREPKCCRGVECRKKRLSDFAAFGLMEKFTLQGEKCPSWAKDLEKIERARINGEATPLALAIGLGLHELQELHAIPWFYEDND